MSPEAGVKQASNDSSGCVGSAVRLRRSVRAFRQAAVPEALLDHILTLALRAPSGGNLQPWRIHVVTGVSLARLTDRVVDQQRAGQQEAPSHAIYPGNLWEPYRTRRFEVGEDLYRTIGIERADRAGRLAQVEQNFRFFGAPVGLFFTIDRRMVAAQWIDLGMIMQTVMLLAVEGGLATCPQAAWALWPDTLRDELELDETMMVAAGMALGYEDSDHPINALQTSRQEGQHVFRHHR
jgi:nitroreductase